VLLDRVEDLIEEDPVGKLDFLALDFIGDCRKYLY